MCIVLRITWITSENIHTEELIFRIKWMDLNFRNIVWICFFKIFSFSASPIFVGKPTKVKLLIN
jgi:hypothetical protein